MPFKRDRMFIIKGDDIKYDKTDIWRLRNALREVNQKRIMNAPIVKSLKKRQICIVNGQKVWKCPMCKTDSRRLTVAHIGKRSIDIIDEVMRANPTLGLITLDNKIMQMQD